MHERFESCSCHNSNHLQKNRGKTERDIKRELKSYNHRKSSQGKVELLSSIAAENSPPASLAACSWTLFKTTSREKEITHFLFHYSYMTQSIIPICSFFNSIFVVVIVYIQ